MWEKENLKTIYRVDDVYTDRSNVYRMDKNENTWEFPQEFLEKIKEKITSEMFTCYPNLKNVKEKLSKHLNVDEDCLFFHSGSDLIIKNIYECYIELGDIILLPNPVYAMSRVYADIYQAEVEYIEYDEGYSLDVNKLIEKVVQVDPKIVVIENPNGNLGTYIEKSEIEKILDVTCKKNVIVILDEAYVDFTDIKTNDLIYKYNNLMIVRTMSKAWGLAGLRMGYVISDSKNITYIKKLRPMHEITSFTAAAAETLIDEIDIYESYIEDVKNVKVFFVEELKKRNIKYIESGTHFITLILENEDEAKKVGQLLKEKKYYVKIGVGRDKYARMLRIGLLPMEDMKRFVLVLDEALV